MPYYLDEDPRPGLKYGHITWSTVVINQKLKVTNLTKERLERGLRHGLKMTMPEEEIKLVVNGRENHIGIGLPQEEPEKPGGLWVPWRR